jgi:hypothetical protein
MPFLHFSPDNIGTQGFFIDTVCSGQKILSLSLFKRPRGYGKPENFAAVFAFQCYRLEYGDGEDHAKRAGSSKPSMAAVAAFDDLSGQFIFYRISIDR